MSLPQERAVSYTAIIDGILASADLSTISAKRIRKGIQATVDYDIAPEKEAINALINSRFDRAAERQNGENGTSAPEPPAHTEEAAPTPAAPTVPVAAPPSSAPLAATATTNGVHKPIDSASPIKRAVSSDDAASPPSPSVAPSSPLSDPMDHHTATPPKKKHKKTASTVEDDAEFARRLQLEENARMGRATRGGGAAAAKKKSSSAAGGKGKVVKRKKKSATRLDGSDDSELEGASEKEVKRTGGFHKPMNLSMPLATLLGETQLSRPQTVKKIWEYVKARDLQDPNDKRQIRCDDAMRAVFKSDRVHMFTMNKILNQNLYALDE